MSDLRQAVRLLASRPGFTLPIVLALALGIGVNTAIFGFVDGLLFRPLPIERLNEVVRVTAVLPEHPADYFNSSYPVFTDYRDGARAFTGLAAYADDNAVHMSLDAGAPERLTATLVSGPSFEILGTRAWRGRLRDRHSPRGGAASAATRPLAAVVPVGQLVAIGIAAAQGPARRAARVDPSLALHADS